MEAGFNPHPARRPGVTSARRAATSWNPFQSSPGPEAGCNSARIAQNSPNAAFQSSPGPEAGCNVSRVGLPRLLGEFQSSPGPEAGCNTGISVVCPSFSTFQSSPGPEAGCNCFVVEQASGGPRGFNPHPARRPGVTRRRTSAPRKARSFNPHPARRPGVTRADAGGSASRQLFQSSPGPEAGCNFQRDAGDGWEILVSILTRPGGRV